MGPTNLALVQLYQADQSLRDANRRLEAASKDVRVQERRVADLTGRLATARTQQKEKQATSGNIDLDLRAREEHIEKLRTQQQNARNNKEYQALLMEINTEKVDKTKIEEESLSLMETLEKGAAEIKDLETQLSAETEKLSTIKTQLGDRLSQLQADIDALVPDRQSAEASVPARARDAFNRLADHLDGEAMAAIERPDRRREEYSCTSCMMDLVTDVYNKLHSRDEIVFCPSCKRILYIPEDLTVDQAMRTKKPATRGKDAGRAAPVRTNRSEVVSAFQAPPEPDFAPMPEGWAALLESASRDSVEVSIADASVAIECGVLIDENLVGFYNAKSPEHLAALIERRRGEANLAGQVVIHSRESIEAAQNA